MILVTLGTNDKSFTRLLDGIHHAIEEGIIQEEVIVQAGYTKYQDVKMNIHSSFEREEFERFIDEARILITHGGVGTIMTALKKKKKILAAARLSQYHEHVNDHQTQLLDAFDEAGYLIYMRDLNNLKPYFEQIETFTPKELESNQDVIVEYLTDWIDSH